MLFLLIGIFLVGKGQTSLVDLHVDTNVCVGETFLICDTSVVDSVTYFYTYNGTSMCDNEVLFHSSGDCTIDSVLICIYGGDTMVMINKTIHVNPLPQVTITVTDPNCFYDDFGTVKVVSNSLPIDNSDFCYWKSGNNQTGYLFGHQNSFLSTCPVGYDTLVVSAFQTGCSVVIPIEIVRPDTIRAYNVSTKAQTICDPNDNGEVSFSISGGVGPYYIIYGTFADTTETNANYQIQNLVATNHAFKIVDSNGCMVDTIIHIDSALVSIDSIIHTDNICYGDSIGTITVFVSGGTSPYQVICNDDSIMLNSVGSVSFDSLGAGNYTMVVIDSNGCTTDTTISISENPRWLPEISYSSLTNVSCDGITLGSISVVVENATEYAWDLQNFQNVYPDSVGSCLSSANLGSHYLYVKDSNGCKADTIFVFNIDQDTIPVVFAFTSEDTVCAGDLVTLTATGADTYIWYSGTDSIGTGNSITLPFDSTTIIVVEGFGNGCSDKDTVTVVVNSLPTLIADPNYYICVNGIFDTLELFDAAFVHFDYSLSLDSVEIDVVNDSLLTLFAWITDINACRNTATASVSIKDVVIPSDFQYSVTICENSNALEIVDSTINRYNNITCVDTLYYTLNDQNTLGFYSVKYNFSNNGCSKSADQQIVIRRNLNIDSLIVTEPLCFGDNNGSISIFTNRNTVNYVWSDDSIQNGYRDSLFAGQYFVSITDTDNVCSIDTTITVDEPEKLQIHAYTEKQFDCTSGIVSLSVIGGAQPYNLQDYENISWRDTLGTTKYCVISGLEAESYTFSVYDSNGCNSDTTIQIMDNSLVLTTAGTNPTCYGSSNGEIQVNVANGNAPYTIICDGDSVINNSFTFTGLPDGSHVVTVIDSLDCRVSDTVVLSEPSQINISVNSLTNEYCNMPGQIIVSATGGTGPLSYLWDNGTVGQIADSLPGNHTYTVTVSDSMHCSQSLQIPVGVDPMPTLYFDWIASPACYGDSNGTAYVTWMGIHPATDSYIWDNGVTTPWNLSLTSGNHSVTVSDSRGCQISDSVNIPFVEPIQIVLSKQNANCNFEGLIEIDSIRGGTAPYSTVWNGNVSSPLVGMMYTLTVSDVNGCTVTDSISINFDSSPSITNVSSTAVNCYGESNGSAHVFVNGGTGALSYVWYPGPLHNFDTISSLSAGNYMVVVEDDNQCRDTATFIITQPDELSVVLTTEDVNCDATVLGIIQIDTITGGTQNYSHFLDGIDKTGYYYMNNIQMGTHVLKILDHNGCSITDTVVIGQHSTPSIQAQVISDVPCHGEYTGSAIVYTNAQNPTILWDNYEITDTAVMLNAGVHNVTITDVYNCHVSASVTISEPQALDCVTNTFITNCNNGNAVVTAMGGVGPYSYDWGGGNNSNQISNLTPGALYSVSVTDGNGCTIVDSIVVHLPQNPLSVNITAGNILCHGGTTSATANVSGGSGLYSNYVWDGQSANSETTLLSAGTHTVSVEDSYGCSATGNITIAEPTAITFDTAIVSNANCHSTTGSICLQVSGGTQPFSYAWSNYPYNTCCPIGLIPGTYYVTVTDAAGCIATNSYVIGVDSNPVANITPSSTNICAGDNVNLTATGGVSYQWSNGSILQNMIDTPTNTTTYTVIVTDQNGCSDVASINVQVHQASASISGPMQVCAGDQVILTATGGTSFLWSTGQNSSIINVSPLSTTIYTVTVTDSYGCSDEASINVVVNDLTANITASSTSITAGTPVVLSSDIADEYTWSTGETLQTIVVYPTVTTQYSLVVRTGNCTDITSITINVVNSTDPDDPNDPDNPSDPDDPNDPNNPTTILPLNFELGDLHYVCYNHDPIVLQNYVNIDLSHGGQVNFVGPGVAGGIFYPSSVGPAGTFQIMAFYTDPITHQEYQGAQSITVQPGTTLDWILNQSVVYLYSQPFVLTGAQPLGGVYSGNGVFHDNGVYYFDPAVAGLGNHTLTYTYTNEWGCESVTSKMISVSSQTGIDDVLDADISVYPNPVNSVLNISLNKNISDILLIDMLGRLVEQQQVCGQSKIQINMDTYSNGIYLLRFVSQDGQITTKKVIKQ